ncbi:MAG TPA: aspartate-semialdehyde dehydrogenase [Candidatus Sulfotelmatobacter sp.]|nr:aspartate-semialdehyde dehydrogenase [Candidatus Sulfotelmatobacter sp.]
MGVIDTVAPTLRGRHKARDFTKSVRLATPTVAVVGATGAVGVELLRCLETRRFPLSGLRLIASPRSAGKRLPFAGVGFPVEALGPRSFDGIDIALFSAGSATAQAWAPRAVAAGAIVVDNSSAFRMDPGVPLVVPEINRAAIGRHKGIIANPNCVAIIAGMALWPIHRANPIRRVIASTYQSASGAGAAAMAELRAATAAALDGRDVAPSVLPHPYAFNLFNHNTPIDPATGANGEETKVVNETRKIFGAPDLAMAITCVRVPVMRAHAIALTVECAAPITPDAARALIADAPGVRLVDDAARNHFPMPVEASGRDEVLVGRIRADASDPTGRSIALFVVGDQLLKGAALNALQIAEGLLQ